MFGLIVSNKSEIGLVDQGSRLKCLPWLFLGYFGGRELPQLLIDHGQQLLGGLSVALFDG